LKRAILHRKNSLFYKTEEGARVGDIYMSLIHTAEMNDVNPFDYLQAVQRNHVLAEGNPVEWMPWSYLATLKGLEAQQPPECWAVWFQVSPEDSTKDLPIGLSRFAAGVISARPA
jgi:transposase